MAMDNSNLKIWLEERYGFVGNISVELLRSYTNDVYLVKTSSDRFILKLYSPVWRSESEILWEIDLLNHLKRKGVRISAAINANDSKCVSTYFVNKENKFAVLFEYASGSKPKPPFDIALYYKFGQAAALLHEKSADFVSKYSRPTLDLNYLIDESTALVKDLISNDDFNFFKEFGSKLKVKINDYLKYGLDWGIVHGDLTLDNLHVGDDGSITFYDFDSSGQGWRGMELQGWAVLGEESRSKLEAFLKSYQEVRGVNKNDIDASPYLQAAQDMWLRRGMKALTDPKVLKAQIDQVKTWSQYFNDKL